jgi:hypothetical protein
VRRSRWLWLTVLIAAATVGVLALAPLSTSTTCTAFSDGPSTCTSQRVTLLAQEGPGVLVVLGVPLVVASAALLLGSRRGARTAAIVLTILAFVGAASIGVFFVPTVVAAWVAAARVPPRETDARRSPDPSRAGPE